MNPPQQPPASATFCWPARIYYEDTDAGGIVYYANYLNLFERARTEWLRDLGFVQSDLRIRYGLVFAVRRVNITYLRPAYLDDRITVTAALTGHGRASLDFRQEVRRDATGESCVRGDVGIACVRLADWRPTRIPEELLERIGQS